MDLSQAPAPSRRSQPPPARERSLLSAPLHSSPPERLVLPREATPLDRILRFLRRRGLLLLALAFSMGHLAGVFGLRGRLALWLSFPPLVLTGAAALAVRLRQASRGERPPLRTELALGLLAIAGAYAVVQLSGDLKSSLYPLVYLLSAWFAVAPLPRRLALGLVGAAVLQNVLRYACADALASQWSALVVQSAFTVVFALLYHLLLAARLWAARVSEDEAVTNRLRAAEESARALRLIVADRSRDRADPLQIEQSERRLLLGAVLEIERAVTSILDAAQLALGGHALALYRLSEDESLLELRDGRCAAGLLARGPLPSGDGVLGSVLRHGLPVRHSGRVSGVTWYERAVDVRAVAAVPVVERTLDGTGYVRGVLVADRLEAEPFSDKDQQFLVEIAAQVARAAEGERLVAELHRAKETHDRLQRAADALNRAATVDEVARVASTLALELVPGLELAACTRARGDARARVHVVCAAEGPRASEVDGLEFDDNDGVVAHVVRLGAPLPPRGPALLERTRIFDVAMGGFGSLRVVPLATGGAVLGTLVAAGRARGLLDAEARRRLEALAALVAGAFARALALEEVSLLATTDGLTGLFNRRHAEVLARRACDEAARYGRPLAVLVTDVDFFKKVNDGHGHDAGDAVLRGIAAALRAEARATDVVGRFGGEEFVLVLPDTDEDGARELAERVRRRVEHTPMQTPAGPLKVTLSVGLASMPAHGEGLASLVKAADEALYEAKRSGRNRVVRCGRDRVTAAPGLPA
jgi:diguanylate cyclase (GGDEF)-like protein